MRLHRIRSTADARRRAGRQHRGAVAPGDLEIERRVARRLLDQHVLARAGEQAAGVS